MKLNGLELIAAISATPTHLVVARSSCAPHLETLPGGFNVGDVVCCKTPIIKLIAAFYRDGQYSCFPRGRRSPAAKQGQTQYSCVRSVLWRQGGNREAPYLHLRPPQHSCRLRYVRRSGPFPVTSLTLAWAANSEVGSSSISCDGTAVSRRACRQSA